MTLALQVPVTLATQMTFNDLDLSENEIKNNNNDTTLPFESVVITDVSGQASPNEMRAAALQHVKCGGGYIQISHNSKPVNEFFNVELFLMIYPTLFPYGIGGFEDEDQLLFL